MLTDDSDTPHSRCLLKVCAPAKYRSLLTLKSRGQYCAEGRSANCFLQALETVNLEFWEDKGMHVPMPLAWQSVWTDTGCRWPCRSSCMLFEIHSTLSMCAHSRSDSLNTHSQAELQLKSFWWKFTSQVIYFFKASYCVPLLYIAIYLLNHKLACMWKMYLLTHWLHNALSDWK